MLAEQVMVTGKLLSTRLDTPLGEILAVVDDMSVRLLEFDDHRALPSEITRLGPVTSGRNKVTETLKQELDNYFSGTTTSFIVKTVQHGTEFEENVWTVLEQIPYGETWSYGDVARTIGWPEMAREVGRANGANQISIIVPCHRVIGSDGSLVGYGGGLWRKKWLLEHERKLREKDLAPSSSAVSSLENWISVKRP
jgi:AraC family transcriptional regulator of adaptative response/methylated-DNA-[protein]-cysteine methyltransferase